MTIPGMQEEEGSKQYSKYAQVQAAINQGACDFLQVAARNAPCLGRLLKVADFGSSSGANSATELHQLVKKVQSVKADTEVSIYSVDVPQNNWKVLFSNVAEGYAASPGVYAFAKAGDFYERFPADFLDVVYSGTALQWLSEPIPVQGDILPRVGSPEWSTAAELAAADWRRFLQHCATEMRGGAYMVATIVAGTAEMHMHFGIEALKSAWRALGTGGMLTAEEVEAVSIPVYCRSMEELKAPFEHDPEIAAAFELLELKDVTTAFPAWTDYKQDNDLLKLTDAVTGMWLSVVGPIFRQAVQHRADADVIMAEFERAATKNCMALLEDPKAATNFTDVPAVALSVRRRKSSS